MIAFVLHNWMYLSGLVVAGWTIYIYFLSRERELSLKRMEYILNQSHYLDNDKEMVECTLIVYGKHPRYSISMFLEAANSKDESKIDTDLFMKFEKYLNFIWRISYSYLELGTLKKKDMEYAFGAYFKAISRNKELFNYCRDEGYEEITTVINGIYGSR